MLIKKLHITQTCTWYQTWWNRSPLIRWNLVVPAYYVCEYKKNEEWLHATFDQTQDTWKGFIYLYFYYKLNIPTNFLLIDRKGLVMMINLKRQKNRQIIFDFLPQQYDGICPIPVIIHESVKLLPIVNFHPSTLSRNQVTRLNLSFSSNIHTISNINSTK